MANRRLQILIAILIFAVLVAVLVTFRDAVREKVLIPVAYLFWVAGLVFRSIHQNIFWVALVLLSMVLLLLGLRRKRSPLEASKSAERNRQRGQRVTHWAGQVRRLEDESLWDAISLREIRWLILTVVASQTHLSPPELEQAVRAGTFELPPETRSYFSDAERSEVRNGGALKRVFHRVKAWLNPRARQTNPAFEQQLRTLVESLETQLEVIHGK